MRKAIPALLALVGVFLSVVGIAPAAEAASKKDSVPAAVVLYVNQQTADTGYSPETKYAKVGKKRFARGTTSAQQVTIDDDPQMQVDVYVAGTRRALADKKAKRFEVKFTEDGVKGSETYSITRAQLKRLANESKAYHVPTQYYPSGAPVKVTLKVVRRGARDPKVTFRPQTED